MKGQMSSKIHRSMKKYLCQFNRTIKARRKVDCYRITSQQGEIKMRSQLNYLQAMGNHEIKTWDTKQRVH